MLYKDYERIFMFPIISRTISFLSQDMNIQLIDNIQNNEYVKGIVFRCQTSVIEIIGQENVIIIMSFSKELLDVLVDRFTYGEEISNEEKDEVFSSVVQEVINIVVGNALKTIQKKGTNINISTPKSFTTPLFEYNKEELVSMNLNTKYGLLSIGITDNNLILGNK